MQLLLDTKGLILTVKKKAFFIETPSHSRTISPKKVTSIAITARCTIDSSAVMLAVDNQIPMLFFNYIGKARARLWSPYFQNLATLRRQQMKFSDTLECTEWFLELYQLKTDNQVKTLEWLKSKFYTQSKSIDTTIKKIKFDRKYFDRFKDKLLKDCRQDLMLQEAKLAKRYWQIIGKTLPEPYGFERRSRRPAEDIFNAALNYLYGMTYTIVEAGIFAAGLDPHLGFVHADQYQKSVLAFDLIEPFRPWIDKVLLQECLEQKLLKSHFTKNQHGLHLNKHGKAYLIPVFHQFMREDRVFNLLNTNNKNHIYRHASFLSKRIKTFKIEE